jgi:hydroxypyruvate isomerase
MLELSACLEWLFTEHGPDFGDRIRAAHAAGLPAVEFWGWHGKVVDSVEAALADTGTQLTLFMSEPYERIADRTTQQAVLEGLERSSILAQRLGCPYLVVIGGELVDGLSMGDHVDSAVTLLSQAAHVAAKYGRTLVLEPINAVDCPTFWLTDTTTTAGIIEAVASPNLRMLYDVFHSVAMGESPAGAIRSYGHLFGHVHVADYPGRHEPGSGTVDWGATLAALRDVGYTDRVGLEYLPTTETATTLCSMLKLAATIGGELDVAHSKCGGPGDL